MSAELLSPSPTAPLIGAAPVATRSPITRGRVLVAIDGTPASDAAIFVGDALARRDGGEALICSVYEPMPTLGDPSAVTTEFGSMDAAIRAQFQRTIDTQLRRTGFSSTQWKVMAERGQPARTIARIAVEREACLIVLGLGRHGPLDRALGRETAIQVARATSVPVLAVPPGMRALPRRALVALDFGASSREAARAALALLGDTGALCLVHAAPPPPAFAADFAAWDAAWDRDYERAVESMLAEVERELAAPEGVHVTRVVHKAAPADAILTLAAREQFELIATGSHGYGPIARAFMGSVSTHVLRGATCAALVCPAASDAVAS